MNEGVVSLRGFVIASTGQESRIGGIMKSGFADSWDVPMVDDPFDEG